METALLFEHLVTEQLDYAFGWGAGLYRACSRETDIYKKGIYVGKILALIQMALETLLPSLPPEKQNVVNDLLSKISPTPKFEELDNIICQLQQEGIVY